MIIFDTIKAAFTNFVWYIVLALAVALFGVSTYAYVLSGQKSALKTQIDGYNAVIDSTNKEMLGKQELAVKEIEVLKYRTKERIKIVKEYIYDENKTKCDNAVGSMRLTF